MIINNIPLNWLILLISLIAAIAFLVLLLKLKLKKTSEENKLFSDIFEISKKCGHLPKAINAVFKLVSARISANEYAFYLIDSKNSKFSLKSIHYKNKKNDTLNVSYSGLIPHKKVEYVFPLLISAKGFQDSLGIKTKDQNSIYYIKINGGKGLIQMSVDPNFKLTKAIMESSMQLSEKLEPIFETLLRTEQMTDKIQVLETSRQATKSITTIVSSEGILTMAINMFTRTINAKGGFFLRKNKDNIELEVISGFSSEVNVLLKYDYELLKFFSDFIKDKKIATLNSNGPNFSNIPIYLTNEGVKQILLFKFKYEEDEGIAGFWYDRNYDIDEYQTYSLLLMFSKISEVFDKKVLKKHENADNLETLKFIATLVDDLSPYTVGFSSLMEHYANLLTKELKLNKKDRNEIATAAYLSNIGVAALSYDVFLKKGKYTEFDYEIIKLHSEVGGDIIELLYGNSAVADMVRYHHERLDGGGYPHGLKGEEIPLGARILAVIQSFVARISPRNFREASTFDEALESLYSAVNTQLDEGLVRTFVEMINRIRKENIDNDCSLDYCTNMRFVSKELCVKCPNYLQKDKKCWEGKSNLCVAHGNKCETCFIYTEYIGRKNLK